MFARVWSWKAAVVLGGFAMMFGAGYLIQINSVASKGYEIRKLENAISDLKEEGGRLELKVASEQSVQAVERKVKDMGLVPSPKVEYVVDAAPVVAKR